MPTTRAPAILAICPATDPVAPAAAETTTVSPAWGRPKSVIPMYAVAPVGPVHRHDRQLIALTGDGRAEHVIADDHIFLEAGQRGDHVSDFVGLATRRHDLADPGRPDDFAHLHRRKVARLVVEPGPDRRVETHISGADQRLTLGRLGRRRGDQFGVTGLDEPTRALTQQDLAIG